MHQPDLVVLVTTSPGSLKDFDPPGQADVVLVVVAPGRQRQLQLTVKLGQIVQVQTAQRLQSANKKKKEPSLSLDRQ